MEFPAVGWRADGSGGTLGLAGAAGYYWPSVASSSGSAYGLYFGSNDLGVNTYNKQRGFSVRCVR